MDWSSRLYSKHPLNHEGIIQLANNCFRCYIDSWRTLNYSCLNCMHVCMYHRMTLAWINLQPLFYVTYFELCIYITRPSMLYLSFDVWMYIIAVRAQAIQRWLIDVRTYVSVRQWNVPMDLIINLLGPPPTHIYNIYTVYNTVTI